MTQPFDWFTTLFSNAELRSILIENSNGAIQLSPKAGRCTLVDQLEQLFVTR